jgi:hypothetical protein
MKLEAENIFRIVGVDQKQLKKALKKLQPELVRVYY